MTRCTEFWDKWERDPNFCGLSAQSISEIKGYLELRDKVVKMGVEKAHFYENCPSGACRPILRLADDLTRTEATNYIISCLKRGEKVTQGDLKGFVNMRLKKDGACKVPAKPAVISDTLGSVSANPDKHVAAAKVTINPVIVPDTYRESPGRRSCVQPAGAPYRESAFKTAAQVKAGIAGEMYPDRIVDVNKTIPPQNVSPEEQKKIEKQRRVDIAEQLVEAFGRDMPNMVRDILKEHVGWNASDVFYFGVQLLHEKKGRV